MRLSRTGAYVIVLLLLYVLHSDWWFWNNPNLVMGLPVGLLYHLLFCLVSAGVLFLLVRSERDSHTRTDRRTR